MNPAAVCFTDMPRLMLGFRGTARRRTRPRQPDLCARREDFGLCFINWVGQQIMWNSVKRTALVIGLLTATAAFAQAQTSGTWSSSGNSAGMGAGTGTGTGGTTTSGTTGTTSGTTSGTG